MNKTQQDQSMEDAIAEALAAVDGAEPIAQAVVSPEPSVIENAPEEGADVVSIIAAAEAAAEPSTPKPEPTDSDILAAKDNALNDLKQRHMRLMADFDNYRKRVQREQKNQRLFAGESSFRDILSVVDNIERALSSSNDDSDASSLRNGLSMILNQLVSSLGRHGVKPYNSVGTSFDPERHEAVARQGHPEHDEDLVCEEMQKGYMFHDRLLRAASVIVSAGKLDSTGESASNVSQGPEAES
jgi:molecular chaperone GrpE